MIDVSPINFDTDSSLSLVQIPITLKGKSYLLVEALGDAVANWRNAQLSGTRMQQSDKSDTKTIQLGNMADNEALLVSLCLYYPDSEGKLILDARGDVDTKKRVPVSIVRSWTNRIISPLYEKAMEISGLNKTDRDTVESLTKRIGELQERLDKLKASQEPSEQEALGKN